MRHKNRYMVNEFNRLFIRRNRKDILSDGNFDIDKNNRLIYWLNEPISWRRKYDLPNKIIFQGDWRINPNYDLELILNETKDQYKGDRLVLKGEIISTENDTLVFEVISNDEYGQTQIQLLKLSGFWQANEYNQIIFVIEKKQNPDVLTLKCIWQINKNQKIAYTYEKVDLKTRTKTPKTLTFEGFWQITEKNKLTYILERSLKSRFDFRVQIESPNLYPKEGVIKYRLGIGVKQQKASPTRIISLYGTWKFSRKAGLIFEMDYGRGRLHTIEFGANIYLTKKDEINFSLTNRRSEPLGINITFTHRFLKNIGAESFLRFKRIRDKETTIETGVRIPF